MRMLLATVAVSLLPATPALAAETPTCTADGCSARMTAAEVLRVAERMVLDRKFDEAKPLLAALEHAPQYKMERQFLLGYVAVETGDLDGAVAAFRAVLRDRPDMTRARLELARALMLQGKDAAADNHFRLAEEASSLPPEIERTIRSSRAIIRNRRNWYFNFDFGLAPDSNVNSATNAETQNSTLQINGQPIAFELGRDARRRSGVGQTFGAQGGMRLGLSEKIALAIDASAQATNQRGTSNDDISLLLAAGPEATLSSRTRASIQALGLVRWYGGTAVQKGGGARISYQRDLSAGQRVSGRIEIRRYDSDYGSQYGGWSYGGSASYERVVRRSMIASLTGFVRCEDLRGDAYANTELGVSAGIGGELRHGINAGLSGSVSRAWYDAPIPLLSFDARKDWRLYGRAYVGLRSIRVLGFSPSVTYTYSRNASHISLYDTARHRMQFELARYF